MTAQFKVHLKEGFYTTLNDQRLDAHEAYLAIQANDAQQIDTAILQVKWNRQSWETLKSDPALTVALQEAEARGERILLFSLQEPPNLSASASLEELMASGLLDLQRYIYRKAQKDFDRVSLIS